MRILSGPRWFAAAGLSLTVCLCALVAPARGDVLYNFTSFNLYTQSAYDRDLVVYDMNNRGQVAGLGRWDPASGPSYQSYRGYVYTPGSGIALTPTLVEGGMSAALAINNKGETAGSATDASYNYSAVADLTGGPLVLGQPLTVSPQPLGIQAAAAWAINDSGMIVGECDNIVGGPGAAEYRSKMFLYTPTGGVQDLSSQFAGWSSVDPVRMNNAAQVVGRSATGGFLWSQSGGVTQIADFAPASINDGGQVVGRSLSTGGGHLWTASGGSVALGLGAPSDINNSGDVVGSLAGAAAIYSGSQAWTDLNTLANAAGFQLTSAIAINDFGQIAGECYKTSEPYLSPHTYGYVLDPIRTPGDLNFDGAVDTDDVQLLYANLAYAPAVCDLNTDGSVNQLDVDYLVRDILHLQYGDANGDHMVDYEDFQTMLDHWQLPAGWSTGDWTGDGVCSYPDFQILLDCWQPTGYSSQVPEPASAILLALGAAGLLGRKR